MKTKQVYIASKTKYADMWRAHRAQNFALASTWVDEAGVGETADFGELWGRITSEISTCAGLILYVRPVDIGTLKGAFVEAGMALAFGKPIIVWAAGVPINPETMAPLGSWIKHPLVKAVINQEVLRTAELQDLCNKHFELGLPDAIDIQTFIPCSSCTPGQSCWTGSTLCNKTVIVAKTPSSN